MSRSAPVAAFTPDVAADRSNTATALLSASATKSRVPLAESASAFGVLPSPGPAGAASCSSAIILRARVSTTATRSVVDDAIYNRVPSSLRSSADGWRPAGIGAAGASVPPDRAVNTATAWPSHADSVHRAVGRDRDAIRVPARGESLQHALRRDVEHRDRIGEILHGVDDPPVARPREPRRIARSARPAIRREHDAVAQRRDAHAPREQVDRIGIPARRGERAAVGREGESEERARQRQRGRHSAVPPVDDLDAALLPAVQQQHGVAVIGGERHRERQRAGLDRRRDRIEIRCRWAAGARRHPPLAPRSWTATACRTPRARSPCRRPRPRARRYSQCQRRCSEISACVTLSFLDAHLHEIARVQRAGAAERVGDVRAAAAVAVGLRSDRDLDVPDARMRSGGNNCSPTGRSPSRGL